MTNPFQILLVEDSRSDQRLTKEALKELEIDTKLHVLGTGEEATEFLRKVEQKTVPRPNLVLLDTTLPRKSGEDVLKEIKGNVLLHRIPVVILTGEHDPSFIQAMYDLHADCFVTKPIGFEKHFEVVKAIVQYWSWICHRAQERAEQAHPG